MSGLQFLIKFSYRNLWRSPRRTFIMLMTLTIGTGFIIWDLNFANSGSREIMNKFLSQYAGRYHITHQDYYFDKNSSKEFNSYKLISDSDIPDKSLLTTSTRRVAAPVFVSGEKKTLGVLLTGIDVNQEYKLSKLSGAVAEGKFFSDESQKEIILGKKFAHRISVKVGEKVAVIGQAIDGSVANDLFLVVGLIDFGGGDLEESLAFCPLASAQELLSLSPENYHQRVGFNMDSEELPNIPHLAVTKWSELLPEVGVSVRFIDNFTWVVSVIIVLVVSLGLANTLMITFLEREREFQSLNIIGAQTKWITYSLMLEVFFMGTLALLFGIILGHLLTNYFYYHPINISMFTGGEPIMMGGMTIEPMVKLYPVYKHYWQVPLMIYFFLALTMIYPLIRVIRRSKNAI